MTRQQEAEFEALRFAGLSEMPQTENENTPVWVRAIVKYRNRNMGVSYGIGRNIYQSEPELINVFDSYGYAEMISVHPYKFLSERFKPNFRDDREMIEFIANDYGMAPKSVAALAKTKRMKLIYNSLIRRQEAWDREQSDKARREEEERARIALLDKDNDIPTVND